MMGTRVSQILLKTFAIINSFDKPGEWLSIGELSRRANLPRATGYRLIETLMLAGAIERVARGRYCLGRWRLYNCGQPLALHADPACPSRPPGDCGRPNNQYPI
jgi:DNA-binding IclR family transcriptional regulator